MSEIKQTPIGFEHEENNLAIDFDGVIHSSDKGYHDGTCYGEIILGAEDSIKELSKKYNIIIFTAKVKPNRPIVNGKTGLQLVQEWLTEKGLIDYIDEITSEKPRAKFYIDDKGIRFTSWEQTMNDLKNLDE